MLSETQMQELKKLIVDHVSKASLCHKEFLTLDECCEYTGLSASFIRQQVKEGLPRIKLGPQRVFFNRNEVDAWILKQGGREQ
ncbi:helix-turn-helix transcriptional regulator [Marinomonas gallaica]|uniref:helix-turn-helix transcriptional regulator n=1 Tax=Marinomonas gallaica TaxID=1806667 RepID=UPI003A94A1A5